MVVRKYVECANCKHRYAIRYSVGTKFPQSVSFACDTCGEILEVGYDDKHEELFKNVISIDWDDTATLKNLHPEIAIDAASVSDPLYFPNLDFMRESIKKGGDFPQGLLKFRYAQYSAEFHQREWDNIVTSYRYLKEGRWKLLEEKFGKNQEKVKKKILKDVIDVGRHFLVGKWNTQYKNVLAELERGKRLPGFENAKAFLLSLADEFLLEKMFSLMQEYRRVEKILLPMSVPL